MNKNTLLFIILLFFSCFSHAQEKKVLGKIVSNSPDLGGVSIINKSTNYSTSSEDGGYFSIPASPGDTLVFSSINLKGITYVLKPENFSKKLLFIPMEESSMVLNELFIDRSVNSRTLGFGKSIYRKPSERYLHLATTSGGGIIPVGAIVNYITGRTKMLKQAVAIEKEQQHMLDFIDSFSEVYFTEYLKIPAEYVEAFGFFCHRDSELLEAIESGNQSFIDLLMNEKAIEFKKMKNIVEEK